MAFQVGFDLVENSTQAFLTSVLSLLAPKAPSPPPAAPAEPAADAPADPDAPAADAAEAAPALPPTLTAFAPIVTRAAVPTDLRCSRVV